MKEIIKVDRMLIDEVLSKTETRQQAEDSAVRYLELNSYHDNPEAVKKLTFFILERDMMMIQITAQYIKKKYNL